MQNNINDNVDNDLSQKYKADFKSGKFKFSTEIVDALSDFDNLILWKSFDGKIFLFSETKRDYFFDSMVKKKGFTDVQLELTEEGRNFSRMMYRGCLNISKNKDGNFVLPGGAILSKKLKLSDFSVKIII